MPPSTPGSSQPWGGQASAGQAHDRPRSAVSMYQTLSEVAGPRSALQAHRGWWFRTIWVKDFPTHVPQLRGKRLWRSHASNDAQVGGAASDAVRRPCSSTPLQAGLRLVQGRRRRALARHLPPQVRASESFITRWVNEFINSRWQSATDVVRNAVIAVSDEINHPSSSSIS